ncbi:MAG: 5'-deoxyadenosine deaminase [Anaerolineales bacterium]|nr:5'-deoxyadenosine deaminase [Chloroflexota bacterium]MBL6982055.1 5'-deoxyadenosine deaminase [Anaerolineales bacterium]
MTSVLIKNGYLVTMDSSDTRCYADIFIEGKSIKEIAPGISKKADKVIDATDMLVLPGFVQSHIHLCQSLLRGQADDQPLMDWLDTITSLEFRHTPETLYASARIGIAEMIRSGTTSVIDMGTLHHQDSIFKAIQESGIRAQAGKAMMDLTENLPPLLRESTDDSLKNSIDLMHRWHGKADGRIRYGFAPRWQLWNTTELLQTIKQEADNNPGVGIHGHAGEIEFEVEAMIEQTGMRNFKYLESIGVVGPNVQMAHCIWLDDAEYKVMAETGTHALHCPCCNTKLGSGIAKVPEMLAKGINVALGSDGAPSNNNLDMFIEMRLASVIHKYRLGAEAMPAEDVLKMATVGGAKAIGMADQIGSLEEGKIADIIILDDGGLYAAPMRSFEEDDVVKRLVSSYQSASVQTSIIDGQVVMEDRQLLTMDETEILKDGKKALADLWARKRADEAAL